MVVCCHKTHRQMDAPATMRRERGLGGIFMQPVNTSCMAPGIVIDAEEVTSRLAIRVFVVHLAQGGFIGEDS